MTASLFSFRLYSSFENLAYFWYDIVKWDDEKK